MAATFIPEVGMTVAEFSHGRRHGDAALTTIEKIGKRDIVLANGNRYNVNRMSRSVGGTWGTTWYLRPADDAQVVAALEVQRKRRIAVKVTQLLDRWVEGDFDLLAEIQKAMG